MSDKTKSTPGSDKKPRTEYEALVGLDYGDKRVETGEVVDDIPEESIEWLLEGDYIKEVD